MTNNIILPECLYIHGTEIDQFLYIQVPMLLVKDKIFSGISDSAKILYGLLLNRMSLSLSNGWTDEKNRTYINYTIESVMEDLNCGSTKAKKLFAELSDISDSGVGLIQKIPILNKPSKIYVLNFVEVYHHLTTLIDEENASKSLDLLEGRKCDPRRDVNATHGGTQMRPTEGRKCDPRRDANATPNYHYNNKHYNRNHYPSVSQQEGDTDVSQNMTEGLTGTQPVASPYEDLKDGVLYSVDQLQDFFPYTELRQLLTYHHFLEECERFNLTQLERKQRATEELKMLIDYSSLKMENRNMDTVDALLDYMTEVIATKECITIKGVTYEADMMGNRFYGMDMLTIQHVIQKINTFSAQNRIGNAKHYYIKCLLSAKSDMHTDIQSRVNYDMAHWNDFNT